MQRICHYSGGKRERFFKSLIDNLGPVRKGPHGKPYFTEAGLAGIFFSLSYTQEDEILCLSDCEVGVDCESTIARPGIGKRYKAIASRYFTEDEQAYVESGGTEYCLKTADICDAVQRFFVVWTRKEAYMKYTGNGFSEGFLSFSVFQLPQVSFKTGRLPDAPHIIYSVCEGNG